jgi:hypothetical protein
MSGVSWQQGGRTAAGLGLERTRPRGWRGLHADSLLRADSSLHADSCLRARTLLRPPHFAHALIRPGRFPALAYTIAY